MPEDIIFKYWLIRLADGRLHSYHPDALPGEIDILNECDITSNIVNAIYPEFYIDRTSHIIVTPLNEDADKLNTHQL